MRLSTWVIRGGGAIWSVVVSIQTAFHWQRHHHRHHQRCRHNHHMIHLKTENDLHQDDESVEPMLYVDNWAEHNTDCLAVAMFVGSLWHLDEQQQHWWCFDIWALWNFGGGPFCQYLDVIPASNELQCCWQNISDPRPDKIKCWLPSSLNDLYTTSSQASKLC